MASIRPVMPLGRKPPSAVRLSTPVAGRSGRPKTTSTSPSSTNTAIAVTLIIANQYSNVAEQVDGGGVDGEHHDGEDQDRQPERQVRPPVPDVEAGGDHLAADGDHLHRPVGPAQHEARAGAQVAVRDGAEGTRGRVDDDHLGQRPGDHQGDQAAEDVGEDDRRPGLGDRQAGTEEQAGADRAADPDHGELLGVQATLEPGGGPGASGRADRGRHDCSPIGSCGGRRRPARPG